MTSNTSKWPVVTAGVISWIVLIYAGVVSSSHIIDVAFRIGIDDWQAWTAPFLVDAVMAAGKLGRLQRFTDATRRAALKLFMFGGAMSLVCNVAAGYPSVGKMAHGLVVVIIMVWLESYVARMELRRSTEHNPPHAPAAIPVSPGCRRRRSTTTREALAFREAQAELRRTPSCRRSTARSEHAAGTRTTETLWCLTGRWPTPR